MHDAIKTLSSFQLNVRILAEKEEADMPEGMIISQTPLQGQKVKPHQSIFLVITRKPPKPKVPALYGLSSEDAKTKAQEAGIQLKMYPLESTHPVGTVVAQSVQPGQESADKTMAVSVSTGMTPVRLFPDLRGKKIDEVTAFLKTIGKYNLKHEAAEEPGHTCDCTVTDQHPLPGTLIDINKPPVVHITAKK